MRKLILIGTLLFSLLAAFSQIPMGSWRYHLAYQNTSLIEKVGNGYYVGSEYCFYYFDSEDNSTTDKMTPAIVPSQVFFGEIGEIGVRPINEPTI